MFCPKGFNLKIMEWLTVWGKDPVSTKCVRSSLCHYYLKWLLLEKEITTLEDFTHSQPVLKDNHTEIIRYVLYYLQSFLNN